MKVKKKIVSNRSFILIDTISPFIFNKTFTIKILFFKNYNHSLSFLVKQKIKAISNKLVI